MPKQKLRLNKVLSDVPSEMVQQSLDDLAIVESQPDKFAVDMSSWIKQNTVTQLCEVCFAGSVMACRKPSLLKLVCDDTNYITPDLFVNKTRSKLMALNHFRLGYVISGMIECKYQDIYFYDYSVNEYEMIQTEYPNLKNVEVTDYSKSPKKWRRDMQNVIRMLQRSGL